MLLLFVKGFASITAGSKYKRTAAYSPGMRVDSLFNKQRLGSESIVSLCSYATRPFTNEKQFLS